MQRIHGGSSGLLVNARVGWSPRLRLTRPPVWRDPSLSVTLKQTRTRLWNLCCLLLENCVFLNVFPTACCTRALCHQKNDMSEYQCELLEATGLLQVVLTAAMMRGSEMYPAAFKHPRMNAV